MRNLLLVFGLWMTCGCGSDSPFDYEKVSGKVAYDDGTPIAGGLKLWFEALDAPKAEGVHPRPAVANVGSDGTFECVTSYKYCDGLIPGRHKVAIEVGSGPNGKPLVAKEYTSVATTPLQINTEDAPFDIKVPKPAPK